MPPDGLTYQPEFLTRDEERELVASVEHLPFQEVRMHGVAAKRTVIHYGWDYDYEQWAIRPADPFPDFLTPLIARCAAAVGIEIARLEQLMVARYPPGAAIGWHRDAPMFGSPVVGVSLASACVMRFRRGKVRAWETYDQPLAPRSLYVLSGPARVTWQHSIPRTPELRYSITLRTLRHP
jgi:alkylated DNA repair dioxygenase AlkB